MQEPEYILGENSETLVVDGYEAMQNIAGSLIRQANHSILILTPDLEPRLYDQGPVIQALTDLARANKRSHVHILAQDTRSAMRNGNRLIQLAQRLSSHVKIHNPSKEVAELETAFLLADQRGYLQRDIGQRMGGRACFNDPLTGKQLYEYFLNMWEKSVPDSTLRSFTI